MLGQDGTRGVMPDVDPVSHLHPATPPCRNMMMRTEGGTAIRIKGMINVRKSIRSKSQVRGMVSQGPDMTVDNIEDISADWFGCRVTTMHL